MVKKVLTVEDDEVTRLLNRLELEDASFCEEIIEASNGMNALNLFDEIALQDDSIEQIPEIILLDLNMPVMGGWQFLEAFQIKYPDLIAQTKIFILSSSINPADKERAESEQYVSGFLSKPLDEEQIAVMRKVL